MILSSCHMSGTYYDFMEFHCSTNFNSLAVDPSVGDGLASRSQEDFPDPVETQSPK